MNTYSKRVASALIIRDKKLLIVKKNETWILPGGKVESGETDLKALTRELSEELGTVKVKGVDYHGDFEGISPHRNDKIHVVVYFVMIEGEPTPCAEIKEVEWVYDINGYNVSEVTKLIVNTLKIRNLIGQDDN